MIYIYDSCISSCVPGQPKELISDLGTLRVSNGRLYGLGESIPFRRGGTAELGSGRLEIKWTYRLYRIAVWFGVDVCVCAGPGLY